MAKASLKVRGVLDSTKCVCRTSVREAELSASAEKGMRAPDCCNRIA